MKDKPEFFPTIEYIDQELTRLKLKDSRIVKKEAINNDDLIDFKLVTANDIHKYLKYGNEHKDNDESIPYDLITQKHEIWKELLDRDYTVNDQSINMIKQL